MNECIGVCIDISNHIISTKKLHPANIYISFNILKADKIILTNIAEKFSYLTSFRDILVNKYA
ncbi:MAG: DUF86 domain-containing protein [Elusimicrobiota bacterium]|nr:DUF86 domain-containing protein [Elusimicrobiota bacterium]